MIEIYGKKYRVADLRRRVGNMDQIAGVRLVQLDNGNERPNRAAIIHTGTGLELCVLLDRCLDIASASYRGQAMGWRSTTGDVAPQYFEPEWTRWLRSYFGGLVTTCGLMNVGAPTRDSAVHGNGLHGRIGNAPARDIQIRQEWQNDAYVLSVSGIMRETVVFGENLTLRRTVSTELGSTSFRIKDVVTNEGFKNTRFQLLYHCNIGWPVVDAGSELLIPSKTIAPRDKTAAEDKSDWRRCDAPTYGYAEKVYYHDVATAKDGTATCAIINDGWKRGNGFGVYLRYSPQELPRFAQWKQMGEQDYVVGLEPSNCGVEGRQVDEELGLLHALKPGESRSYSLEFGAVTDEKMVKKLRAGCAKVKPRWAESYQDFVTKPKG
ncbi:MAG: aldose 1-epimerase family protein [Candidatus Hydrogenedentes bacterium]|nr:aldose 1-epimerase family protein [Candidatus Hydrogenedentota bacterium]